MHEQALIDDLMRKIVTTAQPEQTERVIRIWVRVRALSRFTPEHPAKKTSRLRALHSW